MLCLHEKRRCLTFLTLGGLGERLLFYLLTLVENQKRLLLSFVTLGEKEKRHVRTFQPTECHNQHRLLLAQQTEGREVMLEGKSKTTEGYFQPLLRQSQPLSVLEKHREYLFEMLLVHAETTEGQRERHSRL